MDEETRRKLDKLVLRGWKALANREEDEAEFLEEVMDIFSRLENLSDEGLKKAESK